MKYVHFVDNYLLNPHHSVTVALIGCGGTGSQVLTSLGRISYALQQLGHPAPLAPMGLYRDPIASISAHPPREGPACDPAEAGDSSEAETGPGVLWLGWG